MNLLVCFDVDGTIETSNGPVKVSQMRALEALGARVVIVSPSGAKPPGFVEINTLDRLSCLKMARQMFPSDAYLYVSDNNDQETARSAGFIYVDAKAFF